MNPKTVADLIEYLQTLPADATVELLGKTPETDEEYEGYEFVEPSLETNIYFSQSMNLLQLGEHPRSIR